MKKQNNPVKKSEERPDESNLKSPKTETLVAPEDGSYNVRFTVPKTYKRFLRSFPEKPQSYVFDYEKGSIDKFHSGQKLVLDKRHRVLRDEQVYRVLEHKLNPEGTYRTIQIMRVSQEKEMRGQRLSRGYSLLNYHRKNSKKSKDISDRFLRSFLLDKRMGKGSRELLVREALKRGLYKEWEREALLEGNEKQLTRVYIESLVRDAMSPEEILVYLGSYLLSSNGNYGVLDEILVNEHLTQEIKDLEVLGNRENISIRKALVAAYLSKFGRAIERYTGQKTTKELYKDCEIPRDSYSLRYLKVNQNKIQDPVDHYGRLRRLVGMTTKQWSKLEDRVWENNLWALHKDFEDISEKKGKELAKWVMLCRVLSTKGRQGKFKFYHDPLWYVMNENLKLLRKGWYNDAWEVLGDMRQSRKQKKMASNERIDSIYDDLRKKVILEERPRPGKTGLKAIFGGRQ